MPCRGSWKTASMPAWSFPPGTETFGATVSVGNNPTFGDVKEKRVEAYIHDFDVDLYGRRIAFSVAFLRPMERFDTVDSSSGRPVMTSSAAVLPQRPAGNLGEGTPAWRRKAKPGTRRILPVVSHARNHRHSTARERFSSTPVSTKCRHIHPTDLPLVPVGVEERHEYMPAFPRQPLGRSCRHARSRGWRIVDLGAALAAEGVEYFASARAVGGGVAVAQERFVEPPSTGS